MFKLKLTKMAKPLKRPRHSECTGAKRCHLYHLVCTAAAAAAVDVVSKQ